MSAPRPSVPLDLPVDRIQAVELAGPPAATVRVLIEGETAARTFEFADRGEAVAFCEALWERRGQDTGDEPVPDAAASSGRNGG